MYLFASTSVHSVGIVSTSSMVYTSTRFIGSASNRCDDKHRFGSSAKKAFRAYFGVGGALVTYLLLRDGVVWEMTLIVLLSSINCSFSNQAQAFSEQHLLIWVISLAGFVWER